MPRAEQGNTERQAMLWPWAAVAHTPLLLPWYTENREWPFCRCTKCAWKTNENKHPEFTKLPQSTKKLLTFRQYSWWWGTNHKTIFKKKKKARDFYFDRQSTSSGYFTLGIWKHRIRLFPLPIPVPSHPFSMLTASWERFLGTNLTLLQISS